MKSRLTILFLIISNGVFAQKDSTTKPVVVPVPIEGMIGNNRLFLQTLVIKPFSKTSGFSILSVTNSASTYNNDLYNFDFVNVTKVSYNLHNGFGVDAGVSMNNISGFSPTAGIQYVYKRPTISLVVAPDISLTNNHNIEVVFVLENRPKINRDISLYTRLQGFYNYDIHEQVHQRSYVNMRIGVSFGLFTFGTAANFDWYGPLSIYKENYGGFLMYSFM